MSKKAKYLDLAFIFFIGYLIAVSIKQHFLDNTVLSLNFYVGFLAWTFSLYCVIKGVHRSAILILLLFSVFNIIAFSAVISSFGNVYFLYKGDNFNIVSVGINPLQLLILFIYAIINRDIVSEFYARVFNESKDDQVKNYMALVDFYYNKFKTCSEEELKVIFQNYNDYPPEAQEAILQLKEHKGYGYDNVSKP